VVKNIEKSKMFYRELFGLEVIADYGENVVLTEGLALQERIAVGEVY
jgi:catechol 2,3-dioxygenase-like lactoylglutathione lyase family enzyme